MHEIGVFIVYLHSLMVSILNFPLMGSVFALCVAPYKNILTLYFCGCSGLLTVWLFIKISLLNHIFIMVYDLT